MRYHYTLMKLLKLTQINRKKNLIILSVEKDAKQLDLSYIAGGNGKKCQNGSHSGKQFVGFLES